MSNLIQENENQGNKEDLFEPELQNLMKFKVKKVLLVASLYDYFLMEEDGRLVDLLGKIYSKYDLGYVPVLKQVDNGMSALEIVKTGEFDLVISVMRIEDMHPYELADKIKDISPDLPVVVIAYNTPELVKLNEERYNHQVDGLFLWHGDGKILITIIKYIEDLKNSPADTRTAGVQNIILADGSVEFYSTYMLILYEAMWEWMAGLLELPLTYTQRKMRQRKRPRIHLATTYEEALVLYEDYKENLMGLITADELSKDGKTGVLSGLELAGKVREENKFLPVIIQSEQEKIAESAKTLNSVFLNKNNPTFQRDLNRILADYFNLGNLVFRDSKGKILAVAKNLIDLSDVIDSLDASILKTHLERGTISLWLKARTEIQLARKLDETLNEGLVEPGDFRKSLQEKIRQTRQQTHRGSIVAFSKFLYTDYSRFSLIGRGSIGGKARGLAFLDKVLNSALPEGVFKDVEVSIPRTVVIGTDVFDEFMKSNNLYDFAYDEDKTEEVITTRFLKATLPRYVKSELKSLLSLTKVPIAVRSSSLLEDSLYQPFAGVYITQMIPNNNPSMTERFRELTAAVKLVYASTFFPEAKAYMHGTPNRIEDEKMAVIIQEVVGKIHEERYYPDFSGVARSYNYYPVAPALPDDGVVSLALGLGKTVVDGGITLCFSIKYPERLPGLTSTVEFLQNTQKKFWAIDMNEYTGKHAEEKEDQYLKQYGLDTAEKDGTLLHTGSTYNPENDRIYDGIGRDGPRIVTFSNILKHETFPLSNLLDYMMNLAKKAMACPVEMEFAVNMNHDDPGFNPYFGLLQVKPLVGRDEGIDVDISDYPREQVLSQSWMVLGNGIVEDIEDIIFVDPQCFDPAFSLAIAGEISELNLQMRNAGKRYLLVGPGRWGSSESWLGIPVKWGQINQAKVIVEASLPDMNPDASQGSHFFQNITSLGIGYFTVRHNQPGSFVDWVWLSSQKKLNNHKHVCHIRMKKPLKILMSGIDGKGVILKG
ncbi:MAG: histidine kinase [Acidobacteria bacterium]|nr:histidine kinase [Acidobacteriota bacterium]